MNLLNFRLKISRRERSGGGSAKLFNDKIAEGSARYSTSMETEMRLIDVARASIDEVQGDFFKMLIPILQRYIMRERQRNRTNGKIPADASGGAKM